MNETLKTMASRYSCRAYDGKPVEKELLDRIALAAVQSPSAVNRQPWKIAVAADKRLIDEMDDDGMEYLAAAEDKSVYQRFMDRGGKLFYNAPCMFIIMIEPGTELDCGIISENIALAASSLGLGNVICGMGKIPFMGKRGDEFKRRIGFEDGWEFGMAVLVGNASSPDGKPHDPDTSKIRFI